MLFNRSLTHMRSHTKDTVSTCAFGCVFWGSVIVCIFVLGGPVFIVGPGTHCLRELRLQALFQAEQECPPHYSGPD